VGDPRYSRPAPATPLVVVGLALHCPAGQQEDITHLPRLVKRPPLGVEQIVLQSQPSPVAMQVLHGQPPAKPHDSADQDAATNNGAHDLEELGHYYRPVSATMLAKAMDALSTMAR
jgi:hypothetical protein